MTVTLLVPTLNEIDGMKTIMPKIKPEWVDQILVVDGQSTDGTAEYAREQGYDARTEETQYEGELSELNPTKEKPVEIN